MVTLLHLVRKPFFILAIIGFLFLNPEFSFAKNLLNQATFSQVINDVSVVQSTSRLSQRAQVNDNIVAPDLVQTGVKSRAELIASDKTVTRIGSNTILSFNRNERGIDLKQGSILFHTPSGRGGGIIKTAGATAAVTGTTIGVSATSNGGFKLMVLEGSAKASLPGGVKRTLRAGQLTFILPGQNFIPQPMNFDLQRNVDNAGLVDGFEQELPSLPKINKAIKKQQKMVQSGRAQTTNVKIGDAKDNKSFEAIPDNTRSSNEELVNQQKTASFDTNTIINTPTLNEAQIAVFEKTEDIPRIDEFNVETNNSTSTPITVFFANNLVFNTPAINLSSTTTHEFAFLADGDLFFNQGVASPQYDGALIYASRGGISNTSASESLQEDDRRILHDGNNLEFQAIDTIDFRKFSFNNPNERIHFSSKDGRISIAGDPLSSLATLNADRVSMEAKSIVLRDEVNLSGNQFRFKTQTGNWAYYTGSGVVVPNGLTMFKAKHEGILLFPNNTSGTAGRIDDAAGFDTTVKAKGVQIESQSSN
ncbi:MAG: FecR family protein [Verrucomicrobiota bacterium]